MCNESDRIEHQSNGAKNAGYADDPEHDLIERNSPPAEPAPDFVPSRGDKTAAEKLAEYRRRFAGWVCPSILQRRHLIERVEIAVGPVEKEIPGESHAERDRRSSSPFWNPGLELARSDANDHCDRRQSGKDDRRALEKKHHPEDQHEPDREPPGKAITHPTQQQREKHRTDANDGDVVVDHRRFIRNLWLERDKGSGSDRNEPTAGKERSRDEIGPEHDEQTEPTRQQSQQAHL